MSAESELRRYRDGASRHRTAISKASAEVAAKRKKAADASSAASRSSSSSTVRIKLSEAERATREANAAEQKRAGLEKKLAEAEEKITKAQEKYEKGQRAAQAKALDAIRRQNAQASRQFRLPKVESGPELSGGTTPIRGASSDVFLSHASEDKDAIARPLKEALETRGVTVWFDEIKLKIGHSIRQEIEKGIAAARFGVVIISPNFLQKQWTQAELDALFSRKMASGENMILPVWHHVSKDEVMAASPLLAGILALNSSLHTVDEIADQIADVVRP